MIIFRFAKSLHNQSFLNSCHFFHSKKMVIWVLSKKDLNLYLIYFIISFIGTYSIYIWTNFSKNLDGYEDPICKFSTITANEDIFHIHYDKKIRINNFTDITNKFTLHSHVFKQPLTFPVNSSRILNVTDYDIYLQFYMPIIDDYDIILKCSNREKAKMKIAITNFSNDNEFSRLRCHHKSYVKRWCEARNLALISNEFVFFSNAIFSFPRPFLVPGARCPPFDVATDRLEFEPLIQQNPFSESKTELVLDSEKNYFYGGFYNFQQLWHAVFDFTIPFYKFTKEFPMNDTREERQIYVRSQPIWGFTELMKVNFKKDFINMQYTAVKNRLFREIVLGIEKNEKNPLLNRTNEDTIVFQYNFNQSSVPTFRNELLEVNNLSTTAVGDKGKPLVILIDRRFGSRKLVNTMEVYEYMNKTCDFCEIKLLRLEDLAFSQQMDLISRSSVLAGLHGSGLTHVVWMAESRANHSTHLIEFLPMKYGCRNWYHTAANVSRVNYHPVMSTEPGHYEKSDILKHCLSDKGVCGTLACHDALRDQTTTVNISAFDPVWKSIVEQLKSTVPVEK